MLAACRSCPRLILSSTTCRLLTTFFPAAIEYAAHALLLLTDCGCARTRLHPWLPVCCVPQVLPIKQACCQYLRSELSLQTVACTLALATAHDCADLLADAVSVPLCVHVLAAGVPAVVWRMRETRHVVPGWPAT
jgi:hypothetical protein